ncbi:MAG: HD domain-containing phosphohydrolase [Dehalococcoidia bacterium]
MRQGLGSTAFSTPPGDPVVARGTLLRPVRRVEILAHFSGAFDIAEQQQPGHAARVAYLAHEVARRLGFGAEERRRLLVVGLLHDAGVAVRHGGGHAGAGAWVAERFGYDTPVTEAIAATHERWDGRGRPLGLSGPEIPVEGLLVAAAHWACEFADRAMSPLRARAQLQNSSLADIEPLAGPEVGAALQAALHEDETWLAMWDDDLPRLVAHASIGEGRPSLRRLEEAARAMGEVVDSAVRETGRAARVSSLARQIAFALGLPEAHCEAIGIAGHLLDIGQLGVPRHITDKPSILTVDEMELMRCHPSVSARLLERAPGLSEVAEWIRAHHERPDGRGYPGMVGSEELPIAPRILAVADAYWALRAERPYRPAFAEDEAMVMIELGVGSQFDARVVEALPEALENERDAGDGSEAG